MIAIKFLGFDMKFALAAAAPALVPAGLVAVNVGDGWGLFAFGACECDA